MIRGKILQNIEFESNGITEEQIIEFVKIAGELRKIIAKNQEIANEIKEKKKKLYRDASSIRYGELR